MTLCLSSECSTETLINFNCDFCVFCDFIYCLFQLHVLSLRFVNRNLLYEYMDMDMDMDMAEMYTDPVKVAGTFALQEVLETRHRYMERVDDIKTEMCSRFYYVGVMLHQSPLFSLLIT